MKKLLFTLFIITVSTYSFAQVSVNLGPKVGLNLSGLNIDNNRIDINYRANWHVGVFANIRIGNFAIQPELIYSQQGAGYKDKIINGQKYEGKEILGYINIPIMAKYYIFQGLNVELGPQFGFMATAKDKWTNSTNGQTGMDNLKNSDFIKTFDFSICGGLAYDFRFGMIVGLRYNLGVTSINKLFTDMNRVGQISIGWRF